MGHRVNTPGAKAWDKPGGGSGGQLSLEASPAAAGTGLFPTAHSQGAARPQSYSSPRLCPGLGLAATPNTLRVLLQSGSKLGTREDPPLTSGLRNRSPASRSLPGRHSPRHQLPATSLLAPAPCSQLRQL